MAQPLKKTEPWYRRGLDFVKNYVHNPEKNHHISDAFLAAGEKQPTIAPLPLAGTFKCAQANVGYNLTLPSAGTYQITGLQTNTGTCYISNTATGLNGYPLKAGNIVNFDDMINIIVVATVAGEGVSYIKVG